MKISYLKIVSSTKFQSLTLGILLSFIPFLRMASENPKYLHQTLWAEDGLFTLCYKKSSILECGTDGFSGYLQGLPRFTGFIASQFDPQNWAIAVNIQALLIYFLLTIFLITILNYRDHALSLKVLIAGAPTLLAFSGTEIIGVISNDYLLLYYVALVYITFYDPIAEGKSVKISAGVIFVTLALSSPFGIFASVFLLTKMYLIRNIHKNKLFISVVVLANLLQALIIVSQIGKREQVITLPYLAKELSLNSLKSVFYIFYTPKSGDFLPGVKFGNVAYLAAFVLVASFILIFRKRIREHINLKKGLNISFQLASFILVLLISIITNGSVSRYLNLLMLINILIIASLGTQQERKTSKLIGRFLLSILAINLVINFQVSDTRVSEPIWANEWKSAQEICGSGLEQTPLTFTPSWPTTNPHPYPMFEPLTNMIDCTKI